MNRPSAVRAATIAVAMSLLVPSVAHASGGWEGIGTLLGLLAVPLLFIVILALAIVRAVKKGSRIAGIVGIVLGALGMLWQLFWYALESGEENRPVGFMLFGIATNVVVFVLAVSNIKAAKAAALQQPQQPQYPQQQQPQYPQQPPQYR